MENQSRPFLTAHWGYLAMLNYEIAPEVLTPLVPKGTELDFFHGKTFVSMVGFLFQKTRVLGIPIPFHQDFEEINLRFYVRRNSGKEWRRGVVFVKEIVPRLAIALVARRVYRENYVALRTRNTLQLAGSADLPPEKLKYEWKFQNSWNSITVLPTGELVDPMPGSEEEFIAEHYWGYTHQPAGSTLEYRVDHPPWRIWPVKNATLECDVSSLYGEKFVKCLSAEPHSAFLAQGSKVSVFTGRKIC